MPTDDYWESDELQDRLYYAREHEKSKEQRYYPRSRVAWPLRNLRRSRTTPWIIGLTLLFLIWWLSGSSRNSTKVDWSRLAYSQYATDVQSLCNALMVFESLHRLKSKAARVLLYPREWVKNPDPIAVRMLKDASKKYGVTLEPVDLLRADDKVASPGTLDRPSDWNLSITKLRVFDLIQYDRVLHLDSDITLLQHLDELFTLPRTAIAMPRAYWSDGDPSSWPLTSLIMLVEPNPNELPLMVETLKKWQTQSDYVNHKKYDMDLLNHRFGTSALVLPHRPYAMLTAEFRSHDHTTYLGYRNGPTQDIRGKWDPDRAMKEAKLVHFSDWPLPKPWIMWPGAGLTEIQPDCGGAKGGCKERVLWKELYTNFRRRRKNVCRILSVPAPDWAKWKNTTGAGG
ncbi:nucleotide-diphospho-sugar transferase [Microthyrium microscopicum]|uniref:Nucleotide-diphospho-sugar transferase n=1 Tax=Microthyrium microscopicum TaxID=703497 RepID=A0A6A6UE64_9PEZI|nr:nucleotide-diphospho-sugar transferase [Microthyrium microscopicum]